MRKIAVVIAAFLAIFAVSISLVQAGTYRLKAGDTLDVNVWQDQKLNRQVLVGPDGYIAFPLAGSLRAGGKTADAVGAEIAGKALEQRIRSEAKSIAEKFLGNTDA